jgi:hypothetical protein
LQVASIESQEELKEVHFPDVFAPHDVLVGGVARGEISGD